MTVTLEVGRDYRTRTGRKAIITSRDDDVFSGNIVGGPSSKVWQRDGQHGSRYIRRVPDDDIIGFWGEGGPVRTRTVTEIVHGKYGPINVVKGAEVDFLKFDFEFFLNLYPESTEKLTAIIDDLTAIRDALVEMGK